MELEDVSFQLLREITDGFSKEQIIGEGAFGVVYKGVTKNGDDVAVKKLKLRDVNLDFKQFQNELYNLAKLKHQNIVQILGYCYETKKKTFIMPKGREVLVEKTYTALCLEYLDNGSLQKHLSDEFCGLDWRIRFQIIKGICKGLKYMHEELENPIYHLDLKPDNILLDKNMVPKIADFGLSRIVGEEPTRTTKNPYGTPGYQPPEYIDRGEISDKFDIFSLGIIMIRILSGPKGYPKCLDISSEEFIDQVQTNWRNRLQATCITDSLLEAYCHQVKTCTHIALNSVVQDRQKRPDIVYITDKLNEIEIDDFGQLPEKGCHKIVMRTKSKDITGQHKKWNSGHSSSEMDIIGAPETSSSVVEELIVGRTEEKEKIMASLLEAMPKKIVILPIYGIGGIGKTSFARLIYNDPKFKGYSHVWVHVSQSFDLHKIHDSIISQLMEKESQGNDYGKKVMIVLDDLWEDNQFQLQKLKDVIYHDDRNMIILVTTRSELVAERICSNLKPYKILPLTNDMCWEVIKQRSDFQGRDDKEQLIDIGQEIAQKCGGVALAAQSLGFTLWSMNFDEWIKVKDNHIWNETVSNDFSMPSYVLASLRLSYSYMSPYLKPCFTYCATFPKGHKIVKQDLIFQWISLDFVRATKLLSMMQLCEVYIVHLLGLSFFQQSVSPKTSEAYYEQATFFTMHDLVHDLAISLIGDRILDQSKQCDTMGSSCEYALLSDCSRPLGLWLTSHERLIALRFLDSCKSKLSGVAFAPAKSLRVLDLSECSIQKLPDSIGLLKQLRYLNAPAIQDGMVPECITNLTSLIYLSLHKSSNIHKLPESIGEMESLMHLDLSACKIRQLPVSFRKLGRLVHLDLSYCHGISGVSESLRSLTRLQHLNLSSCGSIEQPIPLSSLRELEYLNLSDVPCFGLQQVLVNLTKLSGSLNTLDLSYCCNLEKLPARVEAINSLKFVNVYGCSNLDMSTLPRNKNGSAMLPHFVVHADDGESSSNLWELEDMHPTLLEISSLENVKSAEEAKRIKLAQKQSIKNLTLAWKNDAKRLVDDDGDILSELEPPSTLEVLTLNGYNSISFPFWMTSIATYLCRLKEVYMEDLPNCNVLPPLGQLPNLVMLDIRRMDSIRKIDGDFYGGSSRPFPKLKYFTLCHIEYLEEWNAASFSGEDGLNKLAFPELLVTTIGGCPLLRFNTCVPLGKGTLYIESSDHVLLSSWENSGHVSASTKGLFVRCCEAPLHQWSLLRHLPCLRHLQITDCSDLTCGSTDLLGCISSLEILIVEGYDRKNTTVALPEGLGDLTSLKDLKVLDCNSIKTLPESIQQLTCLQKLEINGCPGLVQWCKTLENKMKLAHIKEIILDGEPLSLTRSRRLTLQNKGAPTKRMEDSENRNMDAIGIRTNHPTLLLSSEHRFPKAKDDESKNEHDASKQQREILELSRDFERLTANDDVRDASESEADRAANQLNLPAQQFSLGSWVGSTTAETHRTQRRRKPAAELIRRKGGTASPPTPPLAGPSAAGTSPASPLVSRPSSTTTPLVNSLQCSGAPPATLGSMYTFTATARPLPLLPMATSKDENKAERSL
ncbi:unnamed protein product [Urochloa decumbens]|uniref:Protein kinase domain-containing protein n=1 Tax=Urochloa decumbens TaxID=240449 RepID=A0ABC9AS63_9POAL